MTNDTEPMISDTCGEGGPHWVRSRGLIMELEGFMVLVMPADCALATTIMNSPHSRWRILTGMYMLLRYDINSDTLTAQFERVPRAS